MARAKIYHVPADTLNAVEDAFHDLGTSRGSITESFITLQTIYTRLRSNCEDFAVSLNTRHPVRYRTFKNLNEADALMAEVYKIIKRIADDTGNCFAARYSTDPEEQLTAFSGSYKLQPEDNENEKPAKPAAGKTKKKL